MPRYPANKTHPPDLPNERQLAIVRPRLCDQLHEEICRRGYTRRTEKSYWIRGYVRHHGLRHPAQMGAAEVEAYLSCLAAGRNVAAATQNQALFALLFLYKRMLGQELPWFQNAKRPVHRPVVLTRGEVERLLAQL